MNRIKVLIADDHAMVREGLRQLLELQGDIDIVGEASDGVEAIDKVRRLKPDVIVLDIAMPRMNGLEAVSLIRSAVPHTRIVILSMFEKESYAYQALQSGASGYVLKGEPSSDLLEAIRSAHAGRFFFSSKVHREVIRGYLEGRLKGDNSVKGFDALSDREKQVFFLLIEGNSSQQMAKVLCLSLKTVEKHRASIARKLGVSTPLEMAKFAIRSGIVDPEFWKS